MKSKINAVAAFHKAFGLGILQEPTANLGVAKNTLRFKLMQEENEEYLEAANEGDLVEVADALTDLLYVIYGAGHAFGIDLDECYLEVHRSNMSKLGEDGRPIKSESGKVLKGPDFFEPNLKDILVEA